MRLSKFLNDAYHIRWKEAYFYGFCGNLWLLRRIFFTLVVMCLIVEGE